MNIKNKIAAVSLLAFFVVPMVSRAQDMTVAQLQAQIQSLLAQIQVLQAKVVAMQGNQWCHAFTVNLKVGDTGPEVTALQTALQKEGQSLDVDGRFDERTASAVSGFQQKYADRILVPNGLRNGTGYVGRATRKHLNSLFGCNNGDETPLPIPTPSPVPIPTPTPTNPAGSLTVSQGGGVQSSVTPGQTGVLVGNYALTASSAEGVNVSSINITANSPYFQIMKVYVNGRQLGAVWTPVSQGSSHTFIDVAPTAIAAGSAATVQIFADISSSASGGLASATTFSGCAAGGMTTGVLITCNSVNGQGLTFTAPSQQATTTPSTVWVSPTNLNFTASQGGGSVPNVQTISVYGTNASWSASASSNGGWLSVSNGTYSNNGVLFVNASTQGLSAGTYSGAIAISGNFTGSPIAVPVALTVSQPVSVSLSPATFNFSIAQGQSPASYPNSVATFTVSPNQQVNWTWATSPQGPNSWVGAATQSFLSSSGATLGVALGTAAANLAPGSYTGTITVSPAPGASVTFAPQTVTVNLTVTSAAQTPTASISANPLTITQGQSTTITWSSNYASSCTPSNAFGTGTMGSNGSLPMTPAGSGTYTYTVICTGPGGTSNPASVNVTVNAPTPAPTPSSLTVSATGFGAVTGRMKNSVDSLGAIRLSASASTSTSWMAVNKITITFAGSALAAGGSTFLNTAQLMDQNNNNVTMSGATVAVNASAGTVTWTFGSGVGGFMVPNGNFTLWINSASVPGQAGMAQSLSATIQNASDVQYSTSNATGLNLSSNNVPLTINSVTYALGI